MSKNILLLHYDMIVILFPDFLNKLLMVPAGTFSIGSQQ